MVVKYFMAYGYHSLDTILSSAHEKAFKKSNYVKKKSTLEDTQEIRQMKALKSVVSYIQKKLDLSDQNKEDLLDALITSELTMNVIETLFKSYENDKNGFCQAFEYMFKSKSNMDITGIPEFIYQFLLENTQTLQNLIIKVLIKNSNEEMSRITKMAEEIGNKLVHVGMSYTELQENFLIDKRENGE